MVTAAVRLTVHRAHFLRSLRECFFVNVTNLSRSREIEITHVGFDSTPAGFTRLKQTGPFSKG
jgi:hypothetical protein